MPDFKTSDVYENPEEAVKHLKSQRQEFESYAKNIFDFLPNCSGKLLDIGCGFGWVVKEAKNRGFDATGIDQSRVYTTLGKNTLGVNLQNTSLEKFTTKEKFDVIVLNHVLEHIKDPAPFLKKIRVLLKADGVFFVATPNIDSLMSKIFRKKWYGLQPFQHVWQFTPDTLLKLLQKNEFKVHRMQTENLGYSVRGAKGTVFKLIMFIAPKINQGDQIFVLAKLK